MRPEKASIVSELSEKLKHSPFVLVTDYHGMKVADFSELRNRLGLLTGGGQDVPQRQRTLRGAIAWSYDLLSAGEAQLFARLAAFQGGLTLETVSRSFTKPLKDLRILALVGTNAVAILDSKGLYGLAHMSHSA